MPPKDRRAPSVKEGRRRPGRPGPVPLVLRGFTYAPPTNDEEAGEAGWGPRSTGGRALAALAAYGEITTAAKYARVNQDTVRGWITRGTALLGDHPDLDTYAATNPAQDDLALAAFALAATSAIVRGPMYAADTITREARTDWRAAIALLKAHPHAKEWRPVAALELSGPGGEPLAVDVRAKAAETLETMVERMEANGPPAPTGEVSSPEPPDDQEPPSDA